MAMNVLIVGVGGQGTLLTSRIIGTLAQEIGMDVKVSEVHGMSQRGGGVVTYVRMGEQVHSPLIEAGSADFLLSFEQMEAMRSLHMVKKGGSVIVNVQKILPMPVIIGQAEYPQDILEQLQAADVQLFAIDAMDMAEKAGNSRASNIVLIGKLAQLSGIDRAYWEKAVVSCVPAKTIESNLKAFALGYNL